MSNFLDIHRFRSPAIDSGKVPLIVDDIPVDPRSAPYLVTSSDGVVWIEEPHPGDIVKAAVRKTVPGTVFTELIDAIIQRSVDDRWGSVQPFTKKGLEEAISYLQSYDLFDVELLVPPTPESKRPAWMKPRDSHISIRPSSWVPANHAVLVPRDRTYVGVLGHLDATRVAAVVHNPSRGVAVLRKKPRKKPVLLSDKSEKS